MLTGSSSFSKWPKTFVRLDLKNVVIFFLSEKCYQKKLDCSVGSNFRFLLLDKSLSDFCVWIENLSSRIRWNSFCSWNLRSFEWTFESTIVLLCRESAAVINSRCCRSDCHCYRVFNLGFLNTFMSLQWHSVAVRFYVKQTPPVDWSETKFYFMWVKLR